MYSPIFSQQPIVLRFFSIISAIKGDFANAAIAVLIAAFTDGLDGRIARLTNTQSEFGEQYDSMSDLVSFGAAPAVLMYLWALAPYGRWAWIATFFFLACAALRLARFNVLKQSTEKKYFQGCPSPIAACTAASSVLFYQEFGYQPLKSLYILVVLMVLAAVMISNIRYRSFKDFNLRSQRGFGYLLIFIVTLVLITANPEGTLFPLFMFYIVSGAVMALLRFVRKNFLRVTKARIKV